ncbi:MAG TPA: zf-HC2 domain-containing protein [Thermoanaerobaculia bacterium]|nr:zf-HC2 domain-containing protein [Thermoanaerobaculia bacterium]
MNEYRDKSRCPSASVLAAFVEGTIDPEQAAAVARHAADCPECVVIAGGAARFLDPESEDENESEPVPVADARKWAIAVAVAATLIIAVTTGWYVSLPHDPLRRLRTLAAADNARTVEGYLAGFPHRRLAATRAGTQPINLEYEAEAERLARSSRRDSGTLHGRGVAALLAGRPNDAVRWLTASVEADPADAEAWNDLAVAHLAVGQAELALAAATRAEALTPKAASAHFNRALALHRLGRDRAAVAALVAAAGVEADGGWRDEIRARQSFLAR